MILFKVRSGKERRQRQVDSLRFACIKNLERRSGKDRRVVSLKSLVRSNRGSTDCEEEN